MKKYLSEFLGTFLLLATVVGSGIMATRLTDNNGVALLINALSTVGALGVLISLFAPISGAHFNPAVSLYSLTRKKISAQDFVIYSVVQVAAAILGTWFANAMYNAPTFEISTHQRLNFGTFLGEIVATFGLLLTISMKPESASILVPAWIGAAYFFTSSTSFANPAVTIAREFTLSFSGIAPSSVLGFIGAQLLGVMFVYIIKPIIMKEK